MLLIALFLLNASFVPVGLVVLWLSRSVEQHCQCDTCGYDLQGSVGRSEWCPECGTAIPSSIHLGLGATRVRYNRYLAILSGIILAVPVLVDIAFVVMLATFAVQTAMNEGMFTRPF